jgi:hypothetical protein
VIFILALAAAGSLAVAIYAHWEIPRFTAGARRVWLLRILLVGVGLAFGHAAARYAGDTTVAFLAYVLGFGAVHLPAAFVLFIKRERGAEKS